jgi:hypothetical protein
MEHLLAPARSSGTLLVTNPNSRRPRPQMTLPNLCDANKAVGIEVRNFILHVPSAKEETITDYLVWRWRILDERFNYVNIKTFSRHEEHATTGADFELELWLVGRSKCIPLLFQAKKFTQPFGGYRRKLNYPNNSQSQLQKLISYAASRRLLPFYSIYTDVAAIMPLCERRSDLETGIYMIDAETIKTFADGLHGRKISLGDLLRRSNPFHCMFCCPLGIEGHYFQHYFRSPTGTAAARSPEDMPAYARRLLSSLPRQNEFDTSDDDNPGVDLPPVRAVGVYDLRDRE